MVEARAGRARRKVLSHAEADPVRAGDYLYVLAPPEKAQSLDRFFVDLPPAPAPDPALLGDFFLSGEATLGALAEIYGVPIDPADAAMTLADYFDIHLDHAPKAGAALPIGDIILVARSIGGTRVNVVALRLPGDEEEPIAPVSRVEAAKSAARRLFSKI